jgi:hypothetical protein
MKQGVKNLRKIMKTRNKDSKPINSEIKENGGRDLKLILKQLNES